MAVEGSGGVGILHLSTDRSPKPCAMNVIRSFPVNSSAICVEVVHCIVHYLFGCGYVALGLALQFVHADNNSPDRNSSSVLLDTIAYILSTCLGVRFLPIE
jgi:hypothetical protein